MGGVCFLDRGFFSVIFFIFWFEGVFIVFGFYVFFLLILLVSWDVGVNVFFLFFI